MPTIIPIQYCHNSADLFERIRDLPYSCWLDSGKPNSSMGRYDIMTARPAKRFSTQGQYTREYQYNPQEQHEQLIRISDEDPYQLVETAVTSLSPPLHSELPFIGGALGYFAYDLGRRHIVVPTTTENTCDLPDMHMGIYHWAIVQDHVQQQSWLAYLPQCSQQLLATIQQRLTHLNDVHTSKPTPAPFSMGPLTDNITRDEYTRALSTIDDYIHAGDCYQVNFAHCFSARYQGDPYTAYLRLRDTMASPYCAFMQLGNQAVLSLSPERFIRINGQQILTQPIKGTAPRGATPVEDQQLAEALLNSEKNRAENLMIVDLMRNDLGKSCTPGSITVSTLFSLESFPNVHHLVSSISGSIAPHHSSIDAFKGCFPGGSITGAPKKRAMEIIEELEVCRRSVYCGSIGYINSNGELDTNIAIRTVVCDGSTLHCWGGGGIVADSNSDDEYQESLTKVDRILTTLKQFQTLKR